MSALMQTEVPNAVFAQKETPSAPRAIFCTKARNSCFPNQWVILPQVKRQVPQAEVALCPTCLS